MSGEDFYVIGAGWGRTGTDSFKNAMEILYGKPCYHMREVIEGGAHHVSFWQKLASGKMDKPDFDNVFKRGGKEFVATCDFPAAVHWKEILKQYPKARVVLTLRDPESWYASCMATIFHFQPDGPYCKNWGNLPTRIALASNLPAPGFGEMVSTVLTKNSFHKDYSKENLIKCFNEYNESVIRDCPKDKLLVFKATDGWEPLCKFLGKEIPLNVPYPNSNSTKEFQKHKMLMSLAGWVIASAPILVIVIAYVVATWDYQIESYQA